MAYKYRICREPKQEHFYVEGHDYPNRPETMATGFDSIQQAQDWITANRKHHRRSNFYQGEWQ